MNVNGAHDGEGVEVVPDPTLPEYLKQIQQLPKELQRQECGLIAIGRRHAEDFDDGHAPSGSAMARVLSELRRLAERPARQRSSGSGRSELDAIRARRSQRAEGAPEGSTG